MRVLILGGTGIIGRELAAVADLDGHRVTVVSRGRRSESQAQRGSVETIVGDAYDSVALAERLSGRTFDAVVDLLSFTPEQVRASVSLIARQCDQYVLVSSATIFDGASAEAPIVEGSKRVDGPWTYPAQKIATEEALHQACVRLGHAYTIVRPYITYSAQRVAFGAWESGAVLSRLADERVVVIGEKLARTPTSLTHSRDLARGILALLINPQAHNEDFNIASEEQVTWMDVQQIAATAIGARTRLVKVPDARLVEIFPELMGKISDRLLPRIFDNSKLRSACPGFEFEYSVRAGYEQCVPEVLAHPAAGIGYAEQGKMDRLATHACDGDARVRKELRSYGLNLARHSPLEYLRYASGRYPALAWAKRTLTSWAREVSPDPYGVSAGR